MKSSALLVALALAALGCTSPNAGQTQSPTLAPASASAAASAASSSAPAGCPSGAGFIVDCLAQVLVSDLNLRARPSTGAPSLGHLRLHDAAYVVAGPTEADGYLWYQLGAVRQFDCVEKADPTDVCGDWFGWAVAAAPPGDPPLGWLAPLDLACPTERTTDAYLSLAPAERLVCAGDGEWELAVYLAEEGGRGCMPFWYTEPLWLNTACNLLFPQPVERELDEDTRLLTFVHPDLGTCHYSLYEPGCPFAPYKGSWVEMTGHLDDPAASTCVAKLNPDFSDVSPVPQPAPDPDQVVFQCRLAFVATAVEPLEAP